MKTIFLTSSLGNTIKTKNGRIAKKCDNSNFFIDRLKFCAPQIRTMVFFASSPDAYEINDPYSKNTQESFNFDGFGIENLILIDHRFKGDLEKFVMSADALFFAGGHVPTQNAFFKEIGLKDILKKYNGIIIGQSAGSMNCAKLVYAPPEEDEEFEDGNYQREIDGLGLVNFTIMPHMNSAEEVDEQGHPTLMQMCLEDSYTMPHYGICDYGFIEVKDNKAIAYGKTFLIKNGECVEICGDKEKIEISEDYNKIESIIK